MTDLHADPDYLAALRAIRAAGGDDLERLKIADWLDERAASVACPQCGGSGWTYWNVVGAESGRDPCPRCRGTGRVGDGLGARVELIRVQCELSQTLPWVDDYAITWFDREGNSIHGPVRIKNHHWDTLRRRQRELL